MANTVFNLNPYFNNYGFANTQNLMEDLVCESILQRAIIVNYLPKDIINFSELFGEGSQYSFSDYYPIPMYMMNYENFGSPQSELMTKFGVFLQNSSTFFVSRRHFEGTLNGVLNVPREGDLLYIPIGKNLMEITHVNHASSFFPHGKNVVWELSAELYSYDGANFDNCQNNEIITELENYPVSNTALTEPADNTYLEEEGSIIIDSSETNPYGFE